MDTATIELQETKAISISGKVAALFELTKPRIAFMLVLTSAAGILSRCGTGVQYMAVRQFDGGNYFARIRCSDAQSIYRTRY